jgi:uncharacterized membrane protein
MKTKNVATVFAILAAALYAINIPLSKLLLQQVRPTMMAAFLYLGAGFGLLIYGLLSRDREKSEPLTRAELPYTIGMIVLDIAAPILLMLGLQHTSSANASLLNNFEIVATSLIAFFAFKELLSRRLVRDTIGLQHTHTHSHDHAHLHRHGALEHSHPHSHTHTHSHIHGDDETVHDHGYDGEDDHDHIHPQEE